MTSETGRGPEHIDQQDSSEWRIDALQQENRRLHELIAEKDKAHQAEVERLEELAYKDQLTGLWNRNGLEKLLRERKYARPNEGKIDSKVAMLLIDIDRFKFINDQFGHPVGDEVLAKTAVELKKLFRRSTDIIARWGGEELVVVVEEHDEKAILEKLFIQTDDDKKSGRLGHSRFNFTIDVEGQEVKITVSGGVTEFDTDNESSADAFKRADKAMYFAKGKDQPEGVGRDRIVSATEVEENN